MLVLASGSMAAVLQCLHPSPAGALHRAYIANINGDTVAVVDVDRGVVIDVLEVGDAPNGAAVTSDGSQVFVTNFFSNSVSVIDTASDTVIATIPTGAGPVGIAASSKGEVYVANKNSGTVSVIEPAGPSVVYTIEIGPDQGPNDVAFDPSGTLALVTNSTGNTVSVIDTQKRTIRATLVATGGPSRVVVSPGGSRAFFTEFNSGNLVGIDLAALKRIGFVELGSATGLALSSDGGTIYVSNPPFLVPVDSESLVPAPPVFVDATAFDLIAIPGSSTRIALANFARSNVTLLSGPLAAPSASDPRLTIVPIAGDPFAIAILPEPDDPPVLAFIDMPAFGSKLGHLSSTEVRISVGDAAEILKEWSLRLHPLDDSAPDIPLAAGSGALQTFKVAEIDARSLAPGGAYDIELTAVSERGNVVHRRARIRVQQRRYGLVPLEMVRAGEPTHPRIAMDGSGHRFARASRDGGELEVLEASEGLWRGVADFGLREIFHIQLSRNGERIHIAGRMMSGPLGYSVLDIDDTLLTLLPLQRTLSDIDESGEWLVGTARVFATDRYQLLNTITGERIRFSDVPAINVPTLPICEHFEGNRPRISADGNLVAFVSSIDLGFEEADRCNVFTYERSTDKRRLILPLGQTYLDQPSMDDEGQTMGLVQSRTSSYADARAMLLDLETGAVDDFLKDRVSAAYDAALSGDGSGVVFSACADLDPTVGNADLNQELFLYERRSGNIHQVSDTVDGLRRCTSRDGRPLAPLVSSDAGVITFAPHDLFGVSPRRDVSTGLAFATTRAVRIIEGNQAPEFDAPTELRQLINQVVNLQIVASDPEHDPIVFFAEIRGRTSFPESASFTRPRSRPRATFRWLLAPDMVGEHTIRLAAFDGRGGEFVHDVRLSACQFFVCPEDPVTVAESIFSPQPSGCGSADANQDGAVTAADLPASVALDGVGKVDGLCPTAG